MENSCYFTYIVECIDGTYYTGFTKNISRRLNQHNGIIKGGAKYTRQRKPVLLRYFEISSSLKKAFKREREIKKLTKKEKGKLCSTFSGLNSQIY